MSTIALTFYTRQACPLCEEALLIVERIVRDAPGVMLHVIDVDTSLDLLDQFDEDVPVVAIDGRVAFKHRVESTALQTAITRAVALATLREERSVPAGRRYLPVSSEESQTLLALLGEGWTIAGGRIVRDVRLPDFATALRLTNDIGEVAEDCGHHPDLEVGWGYVRIAITTHAAGGLSRSDFILAARLLAPIERVRSGT